MFKVTQVVPGWKEALLPMPAGSKWMPYIPSDLAYGERGLASAARARGPLVK